jgi:hypothetical protein
MFRPTSLWAVVAVAALIETFSGPALGAAAGKGSVNQRGGKAVEQMSTKGALNTNAQWSADPDRGWVRADERHKLNEKKAGAANAVKNNEKQRGKGKPKKS